jgi:hypothetical protein
VGLQEAALLQTAENHDSAGDGQGQSEHDASAERPPEQLRKPKSKQRNKDHLRNRPRNGHRFDSVEVTH